MSITADQYEELKSLVRSMEFEFKKFQLRKIKASGQRVRNTLLDIKKLCDKMRKDIQAEIKSMPTRSKPIKIPRKVSSTPAKGASRRDVPVKASLPITETGSQTEQ